MMRRSSLARRLLQIALVAMLLVQAVAFAALPDRPVAASAPPCHDAIETSVAAHPVATPCCDDTSPCAMTDCDLPCARIVMPSPLLSVATTLMATGDETTVPRLSVDAPPLRHDIPPLPPPILA